MNKRDYLVDVVQHIDVREFDARPLVQRYGGMAFQARNLAVAADIYERMLRDRDCVVILTLAGSLCSAGLKDALALAVEDGLVDVIVATGANIVDQDFFEALGFRHYQGTPRSDDQRLRELGIDRIYDTYLDEDELRVCDMTVAEIAASLKPGSYSSRAFIRAMGAWLDEAGLKADHSIVHAAYRRDVPIFCPAFSDCSAGFGLVYHQWHNERHVTIDAVADFRELTQLKLAAAQTGIVMLGGGVPKNFTQDVVVATDILGEERPMHRYAIQLTVADERDGALSGSTLQEACSWGKVDTTFEQMVYGEMTLTLPLLLSAVWHGRAWSGRPEWRLNKLL